MEAKEINFATADCLLVLDMISTEYKIKPLNSQKPESFVICCQKQLISYG